MQRQAARTIWLRCQGDSSDLIYWDGVTQQHRERNYGSGLKEIATFLTQTTLPIDILILDGVDLITNINSFFDVALEKLWFVVTCACEQSDNLSLSLRCNFYCGRDPANQQPIEYLPINGFTLDEVIAAVTAMNVDPPAGVNAAYYHSKLQTNIRKRFYYSGGSFRIYLVNTPAEMVRWIDSAVNNIRNLSCFPRCSSGVAASSLMTFQNNQAIIVSEYTTRRLASKVDESFVRSVRQINPLNSSWQEWVAVLDFLQRVKSCVEKAEFFVGYAARRSIRNVWNVFIPCSNHVEYDHPERDLQTHRPTFAQISREKGDNSYFLIPKLWTNWGFDAILIHFRCEKEKIYPMVKILKVTIAEEHSKLLDALVPVLKVLFPLNDTGGYSREDQEEFQSLQIEYSFITRKENLERFKILPGEQSSFNEIQRWNGNFGAFDTLKVYCFDHVDRSQYLKKFTGKRKA
jgi:hypothetical protein